MRERRKRFGSRQFGHAFVREQEVSGLAAIVAACRHAVSQMEAEDERRRRYRETGQYVGDHDPKGSK
ncbi:hypothetical protein [Streptomyces sp. NBC_00239]|uniref:hypothetical protein n=1 Tax=Streptomyces sp. NBC_00239 TaxID=2903640 RepID=UPI002E2C6FB8|nr:hypothetical protein [Streptomyces sp. NBC_00239]